MLQSLKLFIESSAGEVIVAFALIGAGTAMYLGKIPKAEDAIVAGLTLVSRAMIGGRGNAQ